VIGINLNRLDFAGAQHDPVAAILLCNTPGVDWNIVHGKVVVKDGKIQTIDLPRLIENHNRAAARLLNGV
jgi:hypothetical protein